MTDQQNTKPFIWKVYLLYFSMLVFALLIVYKIADIQVFQAKKWEAKTMELTTKWRQVEGNRGNIFSAEGDLLATSVPLYELRMDMKVADETLFRSEVRGLADSLSKLLRTHSSNYYESKLRKGRAEGNRYLLLARKLQYDDMKRAKSFPIIAEGRYRGGAIFHRKMIRKKPYQLLASRTIGYVQDEVKVGLEAGFNSFLEGANGKRLETRLAGGVWKPVNEEHEFDPEDGSDVITTLDINLQDVAESALYRQLEAYQAHHGTVVVMEVETGYIKAISNLTRMESGVYSEQFNYAVGEATEPGSTFKLPVVMAALEDGVLHLEDSVDTQNGKVRFYDRIMRDSKEGGYGEISMQRAFEVSSNVGISKLIVEAYQDDPQKLINRIKMMGAGSQVGIQIPGEAQPRVKNVNDKDWSGVSLPWMSIGYEVLQTPLQTLTFYNAVANDGKMMKPQLVKEIRKGGKTVKTFKPTVLRKKIASSKTLEQARFLLEGVVEREGTAKNLQQHELRIAGKTGTAQIALGESGYRQERKYLASFAGYFPAENPKYSCIVVVYAPSGGIYGNIVAGPIFREIADKLYATNFDLQQKPFSNQMAEYRVPVSKEGYYADTKRVFDELQVNYLVGEEINDWASTRTTPDTVYVSSLERHENLVPNVYGMGAMDAMYLIEQCGMKAIISGRGIVKRMSVLPGSRTVPGGLVELKLDSA